MGRAMFTSGREEKAGIPARVHEEARVLKHPQGSQVQHNAHHQHGPAAALGGLLVHQHPGKEVHQDGGDHNEHIDRLAIGIKRLGWPAGGKSSGI